MVGVSESSSSLSWDVIVSGSGVLLSVVVSIFVTRWQINSSRRKELVTKYLIDAWTKLEKGSNRENGEFNLDIEEAIAQILLFGTEHQIMLAREFSEIITEKGGASLNELLRILRDDLRKELGLEDAKRDFKFLRLPRRVNRQEQRRVNRQEQRRVNRQEHVESTGKCNVESTGKCKIRLFFCRTLLLVFQTSAFVWVYCRFSSVCLQSFYR